MTWTFLRRLKHQFCAYNVETDDNQAIYDDAIRNLDRYYDKMLSAEATRSVFKAACVNSEAQMHCREKGKKIIHI